MENGVVNLINGLPEALADHAVIAYTEVNPEFARRIRRTDVIFVELRKPPGQTARVLPRLWSVLRVLHPDIFHTRNVGTLEGDVYKRQFKYWRLICRTAERGRQIYDFGRSKVGTGPYDFKRNWGFESIPLAYEYRLISSPAIPQNNPKNPKYRLMIETWRRLPRPIVNWLGPHVVRGLG